MIAEGAGAAYPETIKAVRKETNFMNATSNHLPNQKLETDGFRTRFRSELRQLVKEEITDEIKRQIDEMKKDKKK